MFIASLLLSACAVPGQRAESDNGDCPAGETCSDKAPRGLFFSGSPASDNIFGVNFLAIAVGGTQTVTALSGEDDDMPPFDGDFDAAIPDESVAKIDAVHPPTVVVRGGSEGSSFLRLVEPGTDKLLDRVEIQVNPIDHVTLRPKEVVLSEQEPFALFAGGRIPLVVRLFDGSKWRLADETLALTPASGEAERKAWDLFEVTAPSAGEASFEIKAGGASFSATAQVVSAVDDITPVLSSDMSTGPLPVNLDDSSVLCFAARSGAAAVAGATWAFKPSEGVKVGDEAPVVLSLSSLPNCVNLRGVTAGAATLEVTAGAFAKTFQLMVSKVTMKALHREVLSRNPGLFRPTAAPSAGERARSASGSSAP